MMMTSILLKLAATPAASETEPELFNNGGIYNLSGSLVHIFRQLANGNETALTY